MRLARYHGLGNDYLVWEGDAPVDPALARALCDRHTGVGGDGLLVPFDTDRASLGVTIYNPDGSVAEKSGNGLRILAQWWVDSGRAPGRSFTVWTGACLAACDVGDDDVTVDMGCASFLPADLPALADAPLIEASIDGEGGPWTVTALSVGNPHCVLFVDTPDLDALPWRSWGRVIERLPLFPNRVNVQIAHAPAQGPLLARVWERGAGETAASGSSACAVVAAAVRTGRRDPGDHDVVMPGGMLHVRCDPLGCLRLRAPVMRICGIEVDFRWMEQRRSC